MSLCEAPLQTRSQASAALRICNIHSCHGTKWRLAHARGYLGLGMVEDAAAELDQIPADAAQETDVLVLRALVLQEQAKWPPLTEVARILVLRQPAEAGWWIAWAYATRRSRSLAEAEAILLDAERTHPQEPAIQFNLGCYACLRGDLAEARRRVRPGDRPGQIIPRKLPPPTLIWSRSGRRAARVLESRNMLRSSQIFRQRLFPCNEVLVPAIALSAQRTFSEALAPASTSLQPHGRIKPKLGLRRRLASQCFLETRRPPCVFWRRARWERRVSRHNLHHRANLSVKDPGFSRPWAGGAAPRQSSPRGVRSPRDPRQDARRTLTCRSGRGRCS